MDMMLRMAVAALSVALALSVFNVIWYGWLWLSEQSWGTTIMACTAIETLGLSGYELHALYGRETLGPESGARMACVALILLVAGVQALAMMVRYVALLDDIRGGRK